MIYHSRKHRKPLIFLFLLMLFQFIMISFNMKELWIMQLCITIFILVAILIKFEFVLKKDSLTYRLLLFKLPIYQQVIKSDNIKQMKFKRINWSTKGTSIKVKNNLNVRIYGFTPERVYNDLIEFAKVHSIPFSKSEDYKILEKMKIRK